MQTKIAFYITDQQVIQSLIISVYVSEVRYGIRGKEFHVFDMFHKDKGWYTPNLMNLLRTYKQIQNFELENAREGWPVHPFYGPMIFGDKKKFPECYI